MVNCSFGTMAEAVIPLDKKKVKVGFKYIHALDASRIDTVEFVQFMRPPTDENHNAGEIEEWLERSEFIEQDLNKLLQMPHDKFWCQVVFDPTLLLSIDTFLRYASRPYDVFNRPATKIQEKYKEIEKLYFLVCLRISTHKESKENFFTPDVFGDILYNNFIFDIPKLMDLCSIYGDSNAPLLSKMIENIFVQQPKYLCDLEATMDTLIQIFGTISSKFGIYRSFFALKASESPQKLSVGVNSKGTIVKTLELKEMVCYLSDTCTTLMKFVEVYPPVSKVFIQFNFLVGLASFYEELTPAITSFVKKHQWSSEEEMVLKPQLLLLLRHTQMCILKLSRKIIYFNYLQPLVENSESSLSTDTRNECVESYLQFISTVMSEKRFVCHFDRFSSISCDLDLIKQNGYDLEYDRSQYILDGITECYGYNMEKEQLRAKRKTKSKTAKVPPVAEQNFEEPEEVNVPNQSQTSRIPNEVEIDSLIYSVKDLLPDLGDGFIEIALAAYNYKAESVINALFEESLPADLKDLDRSMPRVIAATDDDSTRHNIHDGDEFDHMIKGAAIDTSRVFVEKKPVSDDILDDKSHLQYGREIYHRHGNFEVVNMFDPMLADYSDEYDDTYDGLISARDEDSADELFTRRPQTIPKAFGARANNSSSEESDSNDVPRASSHPVKGGGNHGERPTHQKSLDFCQDPAVLRERRAQRHATKMANKHNSGNARKKLEQQSQRHDVVGNKKGEGQTKEVLKNRAWKEKNKNKNRKQMADKKRTV